MYRQQPWRRQKLLRSRPGYRNSITLPKFSSYKMRWTCSTMQTSQGPILGRGRLREGLPADFGVWGEPHDDGEHDRDGHPQHEGGRLRRDVVHTQPHEASHARLPGNFQARNTIHWKPDTYKKTGYQNNPAIRRIFPKNLSCNLSAVLIAYKNKPDIRPFSSGIKWILISGVQCNEAKSVAGKIRLLLHV